MNFDLGSGWFRQRTIQQENTGIGYKANHHTSYLVVLSVCIIAVALVALSFLGYFKTSNVVFDEAYCKQQFSDFANVEAYGFSQYNESNMTIKEFGFRSKLDIGFVRAIIYENIDEASRAYDVSNISAVKCEMQMRLNESRQFYGMNLGNLYNCNDLVVSYGDRQIGNYYVIVKEVVIPKKATIPISFDQQELEELGYNVSDASENINTGVSVDFTNSPRYYYELIFVNANSKESYLNEINKLQERECPDVIELMVA